MTIMNKKTVRIIKKDNDFQKFEVLMRNRNKRHQYQEFIVEGVRNVNNALKYNWDVKGVIYSSETKKSEWANNIINNSQIKVAYDLTSDLLEALSDKEESSEIMLLVGYSTKNIINEINTKNPILAIFDRPSNRGNLGTIIRSCDAIGVSGLAISGHSVDLYDPETISSTTGSFFKLPIQRLDKQNEIDYFIDQFKSKYEKTQIIGTSAHADDTVDNVDFSIPTIVLIGNETTGLNNYYIEKADIMIKIPIGGSASSLNVACATSIILYEIQRQRNYLDIICEK